MAIAGIAASIKPISAQVMPKPPGPIPGQKPTTAQASNVATPSGTESTSAPSTYGNVNTGHLEDTQWNLQDSTNGYNDVQVSITPKVNTFPSSQAYFYANNVWFNKYTGNNYGVAYAGLQTNLYNGTTNVGKGVIFSVWDAAGGKAVNGGTLVQFGGEGTGYSVRVPYNWQANRAYRVKMYLAVDATVGNRTWKASVKDMTSGVVKEIGAIYVPASYGKIYGPVTFHERYFGAPKPCNTINPSQVSFTNMSANNGALKATAWSQYYAQIAAGCSRYMWTQNLSNGYNTSAGNYK